MPVRTVRIHGLMLTALLLSLVAGLLGGCGGGSGGGDGAYKGGIYSIPQELDNGLGAVRVDLFFPTTPAKPVPAPAPARPAASHDRASKVTANFPATSKVAVHVFDPTIHKDVVPKVVATRPLNADAMSVSVPDVPPGNYIVFVLCLDAQDKSAGYAIPPATVVARQTTVVEVSETVKVARLVVAPEEASTLVGETQGFVATAIFTNGGTRDVTSVARWTTSEPSVATIEAPGTALGVHPGETLIRATMDGVSDVARLTVGITSLSITPASDTIEVASTAQFRATATLSDGSTRDVTDAVTWSAGTPAVASVDVGVAFGLSVGTTTITATLEGKTATANLAVTDAAPPVSLTVTPATSTIAVAASQAYTATATWADGTVSDVTAGAVWSSSAAGVADVSPTGVALGLSAGVSTITATYGGQVATAQLTVTGAPTVTSVTVTPPSATIPAGDTQAFTATATYSDSSVRDVTAFADWSSADPTVVVVDERGQAVALQAGGPIVISATFGGQTGTATLTANPPVTVQNIVVTPSTATVFVGREQGFTATAVYSDSSTEDVTSQVTWASSVPAVATVDDDGVALGMSTGVTTITATLGAMSDTATLNVTQPRVMGLSVTPLTASREVGTAQDFHAIATLSDGHTYDVTLRVDWSATQAAIASINAFGSAIGLSAGTTPIVAALGTLSANATFTVTATPPPLPPPAVVPVLVADTNNSRIAKVDSNLTGFVTVGELGQPGANFRFNHPRSAVVGSNVGNEVVYVADQLNNQIVRLTAFAHGGPWADMGTAGAGVGQLNQPTSVDQFSLYGTQRGAILVADFDNARLVQFEDRKARGHNGHITGWKTLSTAGVRPLVARPGQVDDAIYYADSSNRIVRIDDITGANPVSVGSTGSGDLQFVRPVDIRLDAHGRIYVADSGNHRIVRFDDMSGTNWTTFGTFGAGTGQLNTPSGLELLSDGRIVIHDTGNNRIVIISDMSGAGFATFGTLGSGVNQFNAPDRFMNLP